MGTVHALTARETATITAAADAYLATLAGPESAGTRRVYAGILRLLAEDLGADTDVAALQPRAVAAWFNSRWGGAVAGPVEHRPGRAPLRLAVLGRPGMDERGPGPAAAAAPQGPGPRPRPGPRRR